MSKAEQKPSKRAAKQPTDKMMAVLAELHKPKCRAHFMPYMGRFNEHAYYFLSSTYDRCTREIDGLLKRGLVDRIETNRFDNRHNCVINAAGRKLLRAAKGGKRG